MPVPYLVVLRRSTVSVKDDSGREPSYPGPPAQIRTCGFPAYGSHLGCLTANRSDGHGCRILGLGSQSSAIFPACCHVVLSLWLRRLSVRHQISITRCRNVTSAGRFVGTA